MKTPKSSSIAFIQEIVAALMVAAAPLAHATTVWNGPAISFSHTDANGLEDQLTPGVAFDRNSSGGGLYNAVTESGATSGISPADTAWAIGSLSNFSTLTYGPCPLEAGNHPPGYVGTTFVVHLINEDIYLSLTLTGWGGQGGIGDKSFSYTRSTAAAPTPSVTITNPASGAVFAAPANVTIAASATVNSGTVTNVQFFANAVSLGSVTVAPFNFTSSSLPAGSYSLTAVATASGISATSAPVNVQVVSPVAVLLTNSATLGSTNFQFSYTANVGLSYVIQFSTNLTTADWISLATNVAESDPAIFVDARATNSSGFYRVGLLPNP
jgi:hypothetical protein